MATARGYLIKREMNEGCRVKRGEGVASSCFNHKRERKLEKTQGFFLGKIVNPAA